MKCFLLAFLGVVVALVIFVVSYPQYSNYQAAAETSTWLSQLEETKKLIAANTERNQSLVESGINVPRPNFSSNPPEYAEVTRDGIIFVQGGREGQLIVLVPNLRDGQVEWVCRGGSRKATLGCHNGI
jgi:hypothetical protein